MDKNSVIGILLIGAIIIGYSILNRPTKEEMEEAQRKRDSLEYVRQLEQMEKIKQQLDSTAEEVVIEEDKPGDTIDTTSLVNRYGTFANAAVGEQSFITLENDI